MKTNKKIDQKDVGFKGASKEMTAASRRSFLKKAAYAAPTVIVLGSLTKPTESKADFGTPPSGPTW